MVTRTRGLGRHLLANFAGLLALLAVAACQTASNTPGAGAGLSAAAGEHVARIRAAHGLPALTADPQLENAALEQAANMARAGRMTHSTGWGKDFAARVRSNGIVGVAAENIAYGQKDFASLFSAWMRSQGHRENILDPRYTRFGLAYVNESPQSERRYWAMVVGVRAF
jgi:uncharacterized protein YkwD